MQKNMWNLKKFDPMMNIITTNGQYLLSFDVEDFKEKLINKFEDDKDNIILFFEEAKKFGVEDIAVHFDLQKLL